MPLAVPKLDERNYLQILDEVRARIPVHNPEWTNFNDSDPGMTLLQLFCFLAENLNYRSNQIPERNRKKFLQLLGIPMRPASAARGVVTLANRRGPLECVTLLRGLPVFAGGTGFLTKNALDVLPVEGRCYVRRRLSAAERESAEKTYAQLYAAQKTAGATADYYVTQPLEAPAAGALRPAANLADNSTVDSAIWLALLARPKEEPLLKSVREMLAGRTLTLGIMPAMDDPERILHAGSEQTTSVPAPLMFSIATGRLKLPAREPVYAPLDVRADDNALENLTLFHITLPGADEFGAWEDLDPTEEGTGEFPPSLEDDAERIRVITWIRIRLADTAGSRSALRARFSWLGINAARIEQRIEVAGERLGESSGEPDQSFKLASTPVISESVEITVNGEAWQQVEDLMAAPPEVPVARPALPPVAAPAGKKDSEQLSRSAQVFVVDRESGEVRFGDGIRGARPPRGAPIFASYACGGGRAGNVGIGVVKASPQLPAGFEVSNPLPTWGGENGESVAEAERNIPRFIRHRDRAVSAEDFRDIVQRTPGIELGRVEIVPLYLPKPADVAGVPGAVTVLVIPDDPRRPEAPQPDRLFLDAVCRHLEPRRLLTTEVHVHGPEYVPLSVAVGIEVVPGRDVAPVREAVKEEIRRFLSPLAGGQEGTGWPLEKAVEDRELLVRAARVPGVAKVRNVKMLDSTPALRDTIRLAGLQLPQLMRITVALGDPEDLQAELSAPPVKFVPVPVLPPEC
jgi:hypothetical protein